MDENVNEDASTTSSQRTLYEDISQSMYLESLTIREQNPTGQSLICSERSSSQFESSEDEMILKSFADLKSSAAHSTASAAEPPILPMKEDTDIPQSMYLESLTIREQNPTGQGLICSERSSSQFESIEDEMYLKSYVYSKSSATHSTASAAEPPILPMKEDTDIPQSMYLESLTIRAQNPTGQILICSERSSSQFESIEDEMYLKSFVESKSSATHSTASAQDPILFTKEGDVPQGGSEQNNLNSLITLPIPDFYIEKLCFTETLIVSKSIAEPSSTDLQLLVDPGTSQEVGGACISVENVGNNLITYSTQQFSTDGGPQASSLLSIVDKNLTLLEERNTETTCDSDNNDIKKEQCLHIYKTTEKYIAWRRTIENSTACQHRGEVSIPVPEILILDGQSLVLMRYLIHRNFSGEFETYCIHISGDVCRCVYDVGKEITLMVMNTQHKMIVITKTIHRNVNKPFVITYFFLPSGHIAKQTSSNSNYFLHMNPLSKIPPERFIIDLEKDWKHDIQLYSEYLDYKQKELDKLTNFSNQQSEFKDMIKDYLVCLLQLKPKYPLDFTIEYFMNLTCDEDNESPT